jgi:predicted nucleotidyltransferase
MQRAEAVRALRANADRIADFGVIRLAVFGSVARNEATPDSDVDILVEFRPDVSVGLFAFARLRRYLTEILGCDVDLVTLEALRPTMRERILREAVYAG